MLNVIKRLLGQNNYQPLNLVEISASNLLHNYRYLSSLNKKVKIAPVLKSNAYGHGIVEIARLLDPLSPPFFGVDSIFEAYELLKAKIKTPILIIGYVDSANLQIKKLPFSYAIWDLKQLNAIEKFQKGSGIHIFVDTGMHREGVTLNELPNFLKTIKQANVKIEGLMSHFASGNKPNDQLTKIQIKAFQQAQNMLKEQKIKPKWIHIANSDATLNLKIPQANLSRVGLALYGISHDPKLKPVLTLKTKIIQIKTIQKGDSVGYDAAFLAKKETRVGILPIGYNDGVDRRLSNKGVVKVNGNFAKILGLVSMNIMAIDLTRIKNARVGDMVTVYSNQPNDPNSIQNTAKLCQTVPYEILVHLSPFTKRTI
jgi:alanine racemase